MVRTCTSVALSALLAVVLGCSSSSESGKPGPDEVAGKVVNVAGAVSAERSGKTRVLTVGAPVYGGDTIVTGDDGSITIELAHNQARWSLGAGKKRQLNESVAWNAPRPSAEELLARKQTDKTTAAGRHAERSAASSASNARATTSAEPSASETAPAKAIASPPPPPPPRKAERARASARRSAKARAEAARRRMELARKKAEAQKRAAESSQASRRKRSSRRRKSKKKVPLSLLLGGKSKGKPSGSSIQGAGPPGGGGIGPTGGTIGGKGAPRKPAVEKRISTKVVLKTSVTAGKLDPTTAGKVMRRRQGAMRACYQAELTRNPAVAGRLIITLVVAKNGRVTSVNVSGSKPLMGKVASCVRARVKRYRFPSTTDAGTSKVVVIATFSKLD
jgi:hypothetical protein